jgi:hypothetical protein
VFHFISSAKGVDACTPTGQLLSHIVGAVAHFERDLIPKRAGAGIPGPPRSMTMLTLPISARRNRR